MKGEEETNPLLDGPDIENNRDVTKPNTHYTLYSQSSTTCRALWFLLLICCIVSQILGYIYYDRPGEHSVVQSESKKPNNGIVTDESSTRGLALDIFAVLPYTSVVPAAVLLILCLLSACSKSSTICFGTTWHASRRQLCCTCVCMLLVPIFTAYAAVRSGSELDAYFIVNNGGLQKNIDPRLKLPNADGKIGTLEFTPFTFLDIKRGTYFEGNMDGEKYIGCAIPIVKGSQDAKDGKVTSTQNGIVYWSSSCASTSSCCKKYHESKGSEICDQWKKLTGDTLKKKKMYGLIQPDLPCPAKGAKNAAVSLHKLSIPESSYSLEVTDDYITTKHVHLLNGAFKLSIPLLLLSLIHLIGLFIQQYINVSIGCL